MNQVIRILGVDPGLRHTGWGVITMDGPRLAWVAHGVIHPDTKADLADKPGKAYLWAVLAVLLTAYASGLAALAILR